MPLHVAACTKNNQFGVRIFRVIIDVVNVELLEAGIACMADLECSQSVRTALPTHGVFTSTSSTKKSFLPPYRIVVGIKIMHHATSPRPRAGRYCATVGGARVAL